MVPTVCVPFVFVSDGTPHYRNKLLRSVTGLVEVTQLFPFSFGMEQWYGGAHGPTKHRVCRVAIP